MSWRGEKGAFPLRSLLTMNTIRECFKRPQAGSWTQNRAQNLLSSSTCWENKPDTLLSLAQASLFAGETRPVLSWLSESLSFSPSPILQWHWVMMPERSQGGGINTKSETWQKWCILLQWQKESKALAQVYPWKLCLTAHREKLSTVAWADGHWSVWCAGVLKWAVQADTVGCRTLLCFGPTMLRPGSDSLHLWSVQAERTWEASTPFCGAWYCYSGREALLC